MSYRRPPDRPTAVEAQPGAPLPPLRLLILGTRNLAVELADWAEEIPGVEVVGFVENLDRHRCETPLEDRPVFWIDEAASLAPGCHAVCGLATTHRDRFIGQVAAIGIPFATIVHPTAQVSPKSVLGEGSLVGPRAILACQVRVGRHVLVNRGTLIGNQTEIADYATIQPGANIAGACRIGLCAYVGMGAIVLDNIRVGDHAVVGAGAVVTKDVPDHVQVIGVPARVVKTNIEGK